MAERNVTYSLQMVLARKLNSNNTTVVSGDYTRPNGKVVPGGIIGGAGPFDLSSLSGNTFALKIRVNGVSESQTVDITAASSKSAVTVDELVTAINATTYTTIPAITASKLATGELKVVCAATPVTPMFEILPDTGGALAKIGIANYFVPSLEPKSWSASPNTETGDTITQTSGNGNVTSIKADDSTTSWSVEYTDALDDKQFKAILLGGEIDPTTGFYFAADSSDKPNQLSMVAFSKVFGAGTYAAGGQKEYVATVYPSCTAIEGNKDRAEDGFNSSVFSISAFENPNSNLPFYWDIPVLNTTYDKIRAELDA